MSPRRPRWALGALITQRRDGLRLAEQALVSFAEEHRAAVAGLSIDSLIEVVTGVDAIRHRYAQVQQAATGQLRMFVTAPFVAVPPGENTAETAAADRGIRIRVVLERAVLEELDSIDEVVDSLQHGLEIRVVEELAAEAGPRGRGPGPGPAGRRSCRRARRGPVAAQRAPGGAGRVVRERVAPRPSTGALRAGWRRRSSRTWTRRTPRPRWIVSW